MNTHSDKEDNKRQSISSGISYGESGDSSLNFEDNRPAAIAQRKLQEMIDKSPRLAQLKAIEDNRSNQEFQTIQKKENNTGLPDNLKSGMENLSGMSLDDVKVHRNSDKPAELQAHAYAQGTDIHLGPGQEKHLAHEAWHVVQQKQGRVKPTMQMKGKVNINDDVALEKEADVMGEKSLQFADSSVETVAQRKLQDLAENRPTTTQLKAKSEKGMALPSVKSKEFSKPSEGQLPIQLVKGFLQRGEDKMVVVHQGEIYKIVGGSPQCAGPIEFDHLAPPPGFAYKRIAINVRPDLSSTEAIQWWAVRKYPPALELMPPPESKQKEAAPPSANSAPKPLYVPAYTGEGVSAKASINVYAVRGASVSTESVLHHSGKWHPENDARYYLDSVTNAHAGGDAEVKTLSEVTNLINHVIGYRKGQVIKGTVVLQTNLGPCNSCRSVIKQFKKDHPEVDLIVQYRQAEAQMRNTGNDRVGGMLGFANAKKESGFWTVRF